MRRHVTSQWAHAGTLAGALLVAGCAATKPSMPPITSLDGRLCGEHPDLAAARPLLLASKPVTVMLDGASPCWQPSGGAASIIAAFRLPDVAEPYLLTVASEPVGETMFSPRLILLDKQGKPVRERPRDMFMFHGPALTTGVRVQPGERFLIVASDPASVGQRNSRIIGSVQHSTTVAGPVIFSVYTGSEAAQNVIYAHNGSVTVTVEPMPKAQ
jgi:hypothetical protein